MTRKKKRPAQGQKVHEAAALLRADRDVARNRKALRDYEILERYVAGIELTSSEIKSIRLGRVSIAEAYCRPRGGELWLIGAHIARYGPAHYESHEPSRDRRLLLHRREIREITAAFEQRGLTVVPMALVLRRGLAKIELGIGRGKRQYEKRQAIAARDSDREIQRALHRRD